MQVSRRPTPPGSVATTCGACPVGADCAMRAASPSSTCRLGRLLARALPPPMCAAARATSTTRRASDAAKLRRNQLLRLHARHGRTVPRAATHLLRWDGWLPRVCGAWPAVALGTVRFPPSWARAAAAEAPLATLAAVLTRFPDAAAFGCAARRGQRDPTFGVLRGWASTLSMPPAQDRSRSSGPSTRSRPSARRTCYPRSVEQSSRSSSTWYVPQPLGGIVPAYYAQPARNGWWRRSRAAVLQAVAAWPRRSADVLPKLILAGSARPRRAATPSARKPGQRSAARAGQTAEFPLQAQSRTRRFRWAARTFVAFPRLVARSRPSLR